MPGTRFSITLPPGGGGIIGEATVWENADNWDDLPTEDLRQGDRVKVEDLGPTPSFGFAQYVGSDWYLVQALFSSETDLISFDHLILEGATAYIIPPDTASDEGKFYYYDDGAWLRTPKDTGYVYPPVANLTELLAIPEPKETDRVLVSDTGFETYGWAYFASGDWYLDKGAFPTVANMESFLTDADIDPTDAAVAIVPTGIGETDSDNIYYVYSEAGLEWQRTPLGTHYIWPQVADWAALLSTRSYGQPSDEVHVHRLGLDHASGTAQRHGGTWKLIEGKWPSVSAMNDWDEGEIHPGAIAFVDTVHPHHYDENSTVYYYTDGAWVQTGPPSGAKVFTLTSLRDFTGSGLADGDYGYYGNTIYRYKAAVASTFDFTGDPMWLPPAVWAGTPSLKGRLVGTETIPTIPVWTATTTVNGITFGRFPASTTSTVTQAGDYIEFQTLTSGNITVFGSSLFTIGAGVKTYMQCDISVNYTGATGATCRVLGSEGGGGSAYWFHLGPSGTAGIAPKPYFTTSTALQGSTEAIRSAGIVWPDTTSGIYSTTELIDFGRDVAVECVRDGVNYARGRRSAAGPGPVSPNAGVGFYMQSGGGSAGGTLTFRVKNWRILTW